MNGVEKFADVAEVFDRERVNEVSRSFHFKASSSYDDTTNDLNIKHPLDFAKAFPAGIAISGSPE